MLRFMDNYPEVFIYILFFVINTILKYLHHGDKNIMVRFRDNYVAADGTYLGRIPEKFQIILSLPKWRHHRNNKILLLEDHNIRGVVVYNMTLFSVFHHDIGCLFDLVVHYHFWLYIDTKKIYQCFCGVEVFYSFESVFMYQWPLIKGHIKKERTYSNPLICG